MSQSLAAQIFSKLPWPDVGKSTEFIADDSFTVWDAVNGSLNGPDENHLGTLVNEGDQLFLKTYPDYGIIFREGKIIGRY